jgi:hypothetical protein
MVLPVTWTGGAIRNLYEPADWIFDVEAFKRQV